MFYLLVVILPLSAIVYAIIGSVAHGVLVRTNYFRNSDDRLAAAVLWPIFSVITLFMIMLARVSRFTATYKRGPKIPQASIVKK